jgi:hypothetical protein
VRFKKGETYYYEEAGQIFHVYHGFRSEPSLYTIFSLPRFLQTFESEDDEAPVYEYPEAEAFLDRMREGGEQSMAVGLKALVGSEAMEPKDFIHAAKFLKMNSHLSKEPAARYLKAVLRHVVFLAEGATPQ